MTITSRQTLGAILGAACLAAVAGPAAAGTLAVASPKQVALNAPVTDVAYRGHHVRGVRHARARHVRVRRHYVGHRRYYYRRHYGAGPALGLFAGILGTALASNYYYDGGYYPYDWGYSYPAYYGYGSYGYGYGYPTRYSYGYARPRYVVRGGHWRGGGWGGPRVAHFGGGRWNGGGMRVGGGHWGGGGMRVGGGGHFGGGHFGGGGHHR